MTRLIAERWFPPSFDPPVPEPEPEIVWPTVEEIEAIREAARREGFDAGRKEGFERGAAEGATQGFEQGLQEGREQAFSENVAKVAELTQTLESFVNELRDLPDVILEPLTDLAWSIAERLSLTDHIDRGPFVSAVEEALMRLPAPGENLLLRVPLEMRALWDEFLLRAALPFKVDILADAEQHAGAFIEVAGSRLDVGPEARRALVLMAMGLLPAQPDPAA
ncbi:MAG: hypothetical protein EBX30_09580 [Betaproteobacteria bacterium]|nr:hypothetical protein [Betaproteobacteria bacterium]